MLPLTGGNSYNQMQIRTIEPDYLDGTPPTMSRDGSLEQALTK